MTFRRNCPAHLTASVRWVKLRFRLYSAAVAKRVDHLKLRFFTSARSRAVSMCRSAISMSRVLRRGLDD